MKYLFCLEIFILFFLLTSNGQALRCDSDTNARVRIVAENVPNLYTCYMEMKRGKNERYGTGFLIHPRVILSAGHNFAWFPSGNVSHVTVYFGSIDSSNYSACDSLKLEDNKNKFFLEGYWLRHKIFRDYSIVILPDSSIYKKVGGNFKLLSPSSFSKVDLINITGSPGDKNLFEIWTSFTKNFLLQSESTKIISDLHAEVRNSGSPIWTKIGSDYYAIGIHSRSWGNCNAAVLLTGDVLEQINVWCKSQGIDLKW